MKNLSFFLFCLCAINLYAQPSALRINEVCASNASLASDLGNFGDWIEIYNPTGSPVDLAGLHITDDAMNLIKYQFPAGSSATIIPASGFILVWADDSAQGLHTNWKISSLGETISLVGSDGTTIIDQVQTPALASDESYGRSLDGTGSFVLFAAGSTTPGASNNTTLINSTKTFATGLKASALNKAIVMHSRESVQDVYLDVYSMDGKLLHSSAQLTFQAGTNFTGLTLPGTGNYLLLVRSGDDAHVIKLVYAGQ